MVEETKEQVNATAGPIKVDPPDWLKGWESATESEGPVYKSDPPSKVTLYHFTFLGRSSTGVCAELKNKLIPIQRKVYEEYARQQAARNRTPSQSDFRTWCRTPISATLYSQPAYVADLKGYQRRGGLHRFGAAVDVDANYNPYVVTGTIADPGGEEYDDIPSSDKQLDAKRKAALEAYQRAAKFCYGSSSIDLAGRKPGEKTSDVYDRFEHVSVALSLYFSFVYPGFPRITIPRSIREQPFVAQQIKSSMLDASKDQAYYDAKYRPMWTRIAELVANDPLLDAHRDAVVADHEAVRYAMVSGNLVKQGGQVVLESGSRDPCRGFLSFRKEIAVAMCEGGLRWGAVDLGRTINGDIMHFDLGYGTQIQTTPA